MAKATNVGWKNSRVTEPEMELILDGWIQNERLDGHRVTGDAIRKKARELVNEYTDSESNFKASKGWLWKFLKRHSYSSRRKSTQNQHDPKDLIPKLIRFILYVRKCLSEKNYTNVWAGDETPVFFDNIGNTT